VSFQGDAQQIRKQVGAEFAYHEDEVFVSARRTKLRQIPPRKQLAAIVSALLLLLTGERPSATAQNSVTTEYEWKANFLAKSASFVDWQGDSPLRLANAFRWCVFGTFSFGTSLAGHTRDLSFEGKKSEVKWVHKEAELASCQIVFVSRSEEKRYAKVLDAAREGRALTVGETPSFLDAGGMVALLMDGNSPAFEVNLEALEASRLKMSSRLLALARRVVGRQASVKG